MARNLAALACLLSLCSGTLQAADAPARAPAEWLETVRRETEEQKRTESPETRSFLLGAALALHPYEGRPEILNSLKGERAKHYARFAAWMTERGDDLLRKCLRGEALPQEGARNVFLVHGVIFSRYFKSVLQKVQKKARLTAADEATERLNQRVERRGQDLLRKGYLGGTFTQAEIDDLRLYAMWVDIRCCGDGVLPFHLGLAERWPSSQGGGDKVERHDGAWPNADALSRKSSGLRGFEFPAIERAIRLR